MPKQNNEVDKSTHTSERANGRKSTTRRVAVEGGLWKDRLAFKRIGLSLGFKLSADTKELKRIEMTLGDNTSDSPELDAKQEELHQWARLRFLGATAVVLLGICFGFWHLFNWVCEVV